MRKNLLPKTDFCVLFPKNMHYLGTKALHISHRNDMIPLCIELVFFSSLKRSLKGTLEKAQTLVVQPRFRRGLPHSTKYPKCQVTSGLFSFSPLLSSLLGPEKSSKIKVSSKLVHYREGKKKRKIFFFLANLCLRMANISN